jgi:hypothetical protein
MPRYTLKATIAAMASAYEWRQPRPKKPMSALSVGFRLTTVIPQVQNDHDPITQSYRVNLLGGFIKF